jgi:hypothetical protein
MKKIIIIILAILMIASPVYALQEIAGPLVISVPIGGTGSAKFGLINDENETITVSLRAEDDVAKYLSFPATVDLEPNKIVYTDIIAKIPSDYDKSLGGNITGYLYALQEGKPGTVQVNVQMMKSITILIPGLESKPQTSQNVENPKTVETTQPTLKTEQTSPITGLIALVSSNSILIAIIVVLVVIIMLIIIKRRR